MGVCRLDGSPDAGGRAAHVSGYCPLLSGPLLPARAQQQRPRDGRELGGGPVAEQRVPTGSAPNGRRTNGLGSAPAPARAQPRAHDC